LISVRRSRRPRAPHSSPTRRSSDLKDVKGAGRGVPAPADQQGRRRGGNVVVAPSMVRPEYAYLNRHLLAERGGPALRVSPEDARSEEHTSELQSRENLVCRLLLEKK